MTTACEPYVEPNPRIYLAAPLFNPYQKFVISQVKPVMESAGFEVFSPLDESKDIWKGRPPAECGSEERQAVMQMNKDGIASSDIVFAWLGGWDPWRDMKLMMSNWEILTSGNKLTVSDETLKRMIPSLPDTGVVWEMGYANNMGIPTIAYLHEGEQDRSFNLMLGETVDAVARGEQELFDILSKMRPDIKAFLQQLKEVDDQIELQSEGAGFSG